MAKTNEFGERANEIIIYSSMRLMFLNLAGHNIYLLSKGRISCSLIWQVTIFRYYQKEAWQVTIFRYYQKGSFHVP